MAEAPTDLSTRDNLEQKILQVLSEAGVPVRIAKLVKECNVPKKLVNQVLYHLKEEARVSMEGPATWSLGRSALGDEVTLVPEVPATQPSPVSNQHIFPPKAPGPQDGGAVSRSTNPQLSTHLNSGGKQQSATIIYQQNPINMICQQGANSHISIANSNSVQIGHGNVIQSQRAVGETVSASDASPEASFNVQTPEPGPHPKGEMTQRVHIKSCFLENATVGNSNKMTVHPRAEGPDGVTGSGGGKEPKKDEDPDAIRAEAVTRTPAAPCPSPLS